MVLSWCCNGAALVLSWCRHGAPCCCHVAVMVLPWCCHGAAMVSWRCHGAVIVLAWFCHVAAMVLSCYCLVTVMLLSWCCHGAVIVLAWFCHVTVMVLSWCCHSAVMVLSCYCHGAVMVSWCWHGAMLSPLGQVQTSGLILSNRWRGGWGVYFSPDDVLEIVDGRCIWFKYAGYLHFPDSKARCSRRATWLNINSCNVLCLVKCGGSCLWYFRWNFRPTDMLSFNAGPAS